MRRPRPKKLTTSARAKKRIARLGGGGSGFRERFLPAFRWMRDTKSPLSRRAFVKLLPVEENLERAKGFEPSTPTLARSCSTPELHPHPLRLPESHRLRPAELCQMRPPNATARTVLSKRVSGKNRPDRLANRLYPDIGAIFGNQFFPIRPQRRSAGQVRFFRALKPGEMGTD